MVIDFWHNKVYFGVNARPLCWMQNRNTWHCWHHWRRHNTYVSNLFILLYEYWGQLKPLGYRAKCCEKIIVRIFLCQIFQRQCEIKLTWSLSGNRWRKNLGNWSLVHRREKKTNVGQGEKASKQNRTMLGNNVLLKFVHLSVLNRLCHFSPTSPYH